MAIPNFMAPHHAGAGFSRAPRPPYALATEALTHQTLFPPDSITWRVNQEPALLLGGGRALLMQLAHPGVAAGVDDHSDFRKRPLRRLLRTLQLTMELSFGTRQQALAAARQINATHRRVQGPGYSATDPRLLLWVHATLLDSATLLYRTFVGPLSEAEEASYYAEAKLLGGLLGIPHAAYPPTLADFRAYMSAMLAGKELQVDDRARDLASYVLRPRLHAVPSVAYWPIQAITAALLPERLRRDYRLPLGRSERLLFRALRAGLPVLVRALPPRLRQVPPARRGRRTWNDTQTTARPVD
jgi:uncharacterized protein (DUF2236 family)